MHPFSPTKEANFVLSNAELLADKETVTIALNKMANEISKKLKNSNPIVVAIMNGGVIPLGMLLPKLDFLLETDYLHPTRYNNSTTGSKLHWIKKPPENFTGRNILLVDDVLDNGITLEQTIKECLKVGAQEVYTAALVEKNLASRDGLQKTDFVGLKLPDRYLFGYGMDYKKYHRNANGIFALAGT